MYALTSDKYRVIQNSPATKVGVSVACRTENGVRSYYIRLYKRGTLDCFEIELSYGDTCDLVGNLGTLLAMSDKD